MSHRVRIALGAALAVAAAAAACGGDDATTATTAATTTTPAETTTTEAATTTTAPLDGGGAVVIEITGFAFSPAEVTVPVGATVEWVNRDMTDHTTTASGAWSAGLGQGESFRYVADEPGEFAYVCTIHMGMAGVVVVEG